MTSRKLGNASLIARFAVLACLVALSAFWLLKTLRTRDLSKPETSNSLETSQLAFEDHLELSNSPAASDLQNAAERFPAAIPHEAVLSFDSKEALDAFLSQTRDRRVEIVSVSDPLLSVRLRYSQQIDPDALRDLAPNVEPNFTLLMPIPVVPISGSDATPFENSALNFIGAFADQQADWGKGIKIAVLDTGIRSHVALDATAIAQPSEFDPDSPNTNIHGTAVASLIAGRDGIGVAPQAELLNFQVLDEDGVGDIFSLAENIVAAVDAGAQIINLSVASYGSNQALSRAVAYAAHNDVVLVAAAGNEGVGVLPFPAAYDSVIAVSAIDANGHPTSFANQSFDIDIAAPGIGVLAAGDDDAWISFSGTSAATALVSGAVAALASQSELSPTQAAAILSANANDSGLPGRDSQLGNGYIDLQRSLRSQTSYADLALADLYLEPVEAPDAERTIYLSAQNRGTVDVPTASLDFTLPNGVTHSIYLGPLGPGETGSYQLTISPSELLSNSLFTIEASAHGGRSIEDAIPENDSKRSSFRTETPQE